MTKQELIDGLSAGGWDVPAATVDWLVAEISDASFGRLSFDDAEEIVLANGEELLAVMIAGVYGDGEVADVLTACPVMKMALGFVD